MAAYELLRGNLTKYWEELASLPGGSSNSPSHFTLLKSELKANVPVYWPLLRRVNLPSNLRQ